MAGAILASEWVPLNENHAIATMVVFVEFSEMLPDRTLKSIAKSIEDVVKGAGLDAVNPSTRFQIALGENGKFSQESIVSGLTFTKRGEGASDGKADVALEQVTIEANRVMYRCDEYLSWQYHQARIEKFLRPAVSVLNSIVAFSNVGMEYLDRFKADLSQGVPRVGSLLREGSEYIAPHVFGRDNLFHSHTGLLVSSNADEQVVLGVRVDAVDEDQTKRVVNIATRADHRRTNTEMDNLDPFPIWDRQHGELKDLLGRTITEEMVERIYLKA